MIRSPRAASAADATPPVLIGTRNRKPVGWPSNTRDGVKPSSTPIADRCENSRPRSGPALERRRSETTITTGARALATRSIEADERRVGDGDPSGEDARSLHRRVLDAVSEVVLVHDADGVVIAVNASAEHSFGLDRDDIVGNRWIELPVRPIRLDGSPLAEADYPAHRTLETGEASDELVVGIRHCDGDLRWMKTRAKPIDIGDGDGANDDGRSGTAAVCSFADVTDQVESNRMKSEFVSVVSHELRTPTACIRSALGLLDQALTGTVESRLARLIEIADANAIRLSKLIDDILEIDRIESGKAAPSLEQTTTRELIRESVETIRPMAEAAGVTVVADEVLESWLLADPDRIIQAVVNLLSNAVKFSPNPGRVTVATGYSDGLATIEVSDEGRGIPPDMLDQVFQPFQQVDASDARTKGGTGLGLAICRSIVEQHGGHVSVTSEVGSGSTFVIGLPAHATPEALASARTRATVILCCPDESWAPTDVLQSLFHEAGCRAPRVGSVQDALDLARAEGADALVLDHGPDGSSASNEIAVLSADPAAANIPAVVVVRSQMAVDNTIELTMSSERMQPNLLVRWVAAFLEDALPGTGDQRPRP